MADMYEKWCPADHNGQYDVTEIKYSSEGVSILMQDDENKVKPFTLIWRHENIIAYNITDETYRSDWWKNDFAQMGRFYISHNSEYLNFYKSKSPLFPSDAMHFVIVGTNTIVDVIATAEPEVSLFEKA